MKKSMMALAFLAALPLAAAADVGKEDIKKLVAAGISDEVILTYIRSHGPVQKMSPDDLIELKQAGASEKVLGVVAGGTAPAAAAPSVQVVQRPVAVPQTTVVYETPTYYYYGSGAYCGIHRAYGCCTTYPYYGSYYYSSCYPRYYGSYYYYGYPRYYSSSSHSHSTYKSPLQSAHDYHKRVHHKLFGR